MKNLVSVTAVMLTFGGATIATTINDTFTSFYIFGDSLTDDGKVGPAEAPYDGNRFSNGDIWAQILDNAFVDGQQVLNFARGGATAGGEDNDDPVPALRFENFAGQVGHFSDAIDDGLIVPKENPLVAAWFGANDLFAIPDGSTAPEAGALAAAAATAVVDNIRDLNALDAAVYDDFLVFNLPDIGETPSYISDPLIPELGNIRVGTFISNAFNGALSAELALLDDDINVIEFDATETFAAIQSDPAALGFNDITNSCVSQITDPALPFCGTDDPKVVNDFLFIDDVHPTTNAHEFLASQVVERIEANINPVPLPASAPLLLAGFGLLGWYGRRRTAA